MNTPTSPEASSWHAVAEAKLVRVLGPAEGARTLREVLLEIKTPIIASAEDLRRFAASLSTRGGFHTAIAAMLDVHATMYEQAP